MPAILTTSLFTRTDYSFSEAVDRVQGDLALRNSNIITSGDVGAWMNEAQRILARDSQAFEVTTYVPTSSGVAEYALPGDASFSAITVEEVLYKTSGSTSYRPLFALSTNQLYAYAPFWRSAPASNPWAYYQRGMSSIGLYPMPSVSGTVDLMVTCAALPPKVTAPDDLFYVPTGCEDALLTYAKLQASLKDAYGEGRDRIAIYREEWKLAKFRATQLVNEAMTNEVLRMGENALLYGAGPPLGLWGWDPAAVATPL